MLNRWLPYPLETGEVFDLPQGHTTVLHKRRLDGDISLISRALPARTVPFAVNQLLSMDEARARIFSPDAVPGLGSDVMGGDLQDDDLTPYPDEDDGDD